MEWLSLFLCWIGIHKWPKACAGYVSGNRNTGYWVTVQCLRCDAKKTEKSL